MFINKVDVKCDVSKTNRPRLGINKYVNKVPTTYFILIPYFIFYGAKYYVDEDRLVTGWYFKVLYIKFTALTSHIKVRGY